jgi:hypothetical protein
MDCKYRWGDAIVICPPPLSPILLFSVHFPVIPSFSHTATHIYLGGTEEEGTAHYRLTSTVMLSLTTDNESSGTFSLSGSIRRQVLHT